MEIAEQEAEELAREGAAEEEDYDETLEVRKSRRLAKGKVKLFSRQIQREFCPNWMRFPGRGGSSWKRLAQRLLQ